MSTYLSVLKRSRDLVDYLPRTQTFFSQHKEEFGLTTSQSCISIGPGDGQLDSYMLGECMPRVRTYYGVEPDAESMTQLQTNMAALPAVKCQLFQTTVEEWEGPPEKVDTILVLWCLYYIEKEARKAMYNRFMQLLNPGGQLVISLATADSLGSRMRRHFGGEVESLDTIRQEIDTLGYHIYAEGSYAGKFYPLDLADDDLINLTMCRTLTEKEKVAFPDFMGNIPIQQQVHKFGVLCIRQQ